MLERINWGFFVCSILSMVCRVRELPFGCVCFFFLFFLFYLEEETAVTCKLAIRYLI